MGSKHVMRMAFKIVCLLALSAGVLGALPTTAGAFDCTSYGSNWTEIRRAGDINCVNNALEFTGSTGSASDMWVTLWTGIGVRSCTEPEGDFIIHRFDNRKGIGIVALYDTTTNIGLFFAMYDNGNTDAITLSTFNGLTGKIISNLATAPLDSKIKENVSYELEFAFCTLGGTLNVVASVEKSGGFEGVGCQENPDTVCLTFSGDLASTGLSSSGYIGLAGWAKSAFVDSTVTDFGF